MPINTRADLKALLISLFANWFFAAIVTAGGVLAVIGKMAHVFTSWLASIEMALFAVGGLAALIAAVHYFRSHDGGALPALPADFHGGASAEARVKAIEDAAAKRVKEAEKAASALASSHYAKAERNVQDAQREFQRQMAEKEAAVKELTKQNESLRSQLTEQAADLARTDDLWRRCDERGRFGRELLATRRIEPSDLKVILDSLHQLRVAMNNIGEAVLALWDGIVMVVEQQGTDGPIQWLARVVTDREYAQAARAFREMVREIDAAHDPRPIITGFLQAYRAWRPWVARLATMLGKRPEDVAGYARLEATEIAFFPELYKRLGNPLYREVCTEIGYDPKTGRWHGIGPVENAM